MISLIYGGSGSGKSAFAEARVLELSTEKRVYLATMQVYGNEGRQKVKRHRKMRETKGFSTIERQRALTGCIADNTATVLLECVSNLVANEMFVGETMVPKEQVVHTVVEGITHVANHVKHLVMVSNNIFEDETGYSEETEEYRRALGEVNRQLAAMSDEVIEVVMGCPVYWKGKK
ncbi:adenosylcobinamide kinase /adenosylcobinamide-phosphate guanylyltransferase [Lachnospiraceae bacterium XBB1006]|nr:adenosylcobinamide kinase /adenosylcobinamide-phosphate guanylyltransferase [Lachnospiraceae bacterium XBB1006]